MHLVIHTDGGSRGNPGPAAAGLVIHDRDGNQLFAAGYFLGRTTNNVAEYTGLLRALEKARELGADSVEVFTDSELMTRQISGHYRVKSPALQDLYRQACTLLDAFSKADVRHVYRTQNTAADALVNAALDARKDVSGPTSTATEKWGQTPFSDNAPGAPLDLAARVPDPLTAPHRETLHQGPLTTELICLPPGQAAPLELASQATLTIMRGRGSLSTDTNHPLQPGSWLHLQNTPTATLTANPRSPLIALLTTAQPQKKSE